MKYFSLSLRIYTSEFPCHDVCIHKKMFFFLCVFPSTLGIKKKNNSNVKKQAKIKQYTYCIRVPTLTTINIISEPKDNVSQYFTKCSQSRTTKMYHCTSIEQPAQHIALVRSIKRSFVLSWLPLHSLSVTPFCTFFRFKIMDGFCLQLINTYTLKCAYISSYKQYITLCQVIWKMYKTWMFLKTSAIGKQGNK